LSFGLDEEEGEDGKDAPLSRSQTSSPAPPKQTKVMPNASVSVVPKPQTKRSLLQESQARETLRKEFLQLQERVKATEIAIPFVFYDGSNIPGGICRVKKGDFMWVFLDGSRKVGAGLGVGGKDGEGAKARREWARVGVDDLMLVRGEIIIPHVSAAHNVQFDTNGILKRPVLGRNTLTDGGFTALRFLLLHHEPYARPK
jgi:protein FAM50